MAAEDPEREYKRFLLTVGDESTDRVALCKRFVQGGFEIRAGTVQFVTTDGHSWEFRVFTDTNESVYLTEGWTVFLAVYDLEKGDQLQCSYAGDRPFLVRFYKKDGLEEDLRVVDLDDVLWPANFGIKEDWIFDSSDSDEDEAIPNADESDPELDWPSDESDWPSQDSSPLTPNQTQEVTLFDLPPSEVEIANAPTHGSIELNVDSNVMTGENVVTVDGSPLPTPATLIAQPNSAQGSVTSKKRVCAERFKGIVKGERLDFLAAVEPTLEGDETNVLDAEDGNKSPVTVATNFGQIVGDPSIVFLDDKGHVDKLHNLNLSKVVSEPANKEHSFCDCLVTPLTEADAVIVRYCAVKNQDTAPIPATQKLDLKFARFNMPPGQSDVVVTAEDGSVWEFGLYRGVRRARVNYGWKDFAIHQNVQVCDTVVIVQKEDSIGLWETRIFREGTARADLVTPAIPLADVGSPFVRHCSMKILPSHLRG